MSDMLHLHTDLPYSQIESHRHLNALVMVAHIDPTFYIWDIGEPKRLNTCVPAGDTKLRRRPVEGPLYPCVTYMSQCVTRSIIVPARNITDMTICCVTLCYIQLIVC